MRSSSKVFVYNRPRTSSASVHDLKELFTSENIFSSRPDVMVGDFDFNLAGLDFPTFVVPGGESATTIGCHVKPGMTKITRQLQGRFNYVGICAGAYIGVNEANVFYASHTLEVNKGDRYYGFAPPLYLLKTSEGMSSNLSLIEDFNACGEFYPHNSYVNKPVSDVMHHPYCVNLSFVSTKKVLPHLYISGPGFFSSPGKRPVTEVIACYHDEKNYTFEDIDQTIESMPAIIRRKAEPGKGGILLSGPHLEACVPDSQMLAFFKAASPKSVELHQKDLDRLTDGASLNREIVESLLKETLAP